MTQLISGHSDRFTTRTHKRSLSRRRPPPAARRALPVGYSIAGASD